MQRSHRVRRCMQYQACYQEPVKRVCASLSLARINHAVHAADMAFQYTIGKGKRGGCQGAMLLPIYKSSSVCRVCVLSC
jgi:hypothetical protein